MTTGGRRALVALACVTVLLFVGRWTVGFLTETWWAGAASPAGAVFALRWAILRLSLEAGAMAISVAWFAAGLLLAARLGRRAGSMQQVSSPTVAPRALRYWALGVAVLLGILTGAGSGSWAPELALALEAPRFGLLDAQFGRDIGFYLATLPVLQIVQEFVLALVVLGCVATTMLYAVAGALRFTARDFALDPAIRLHLGGLGAALALVLGAGYLLEPLQLAAGLRPSMGAAHLLLLGSLARVMAGFALAVALLTLAWGIRGRMMLPIGGWASFALFAIAVRLLAPAAGVAGDSGQPGSAVQALEREAFDLPELVERSSAGTGALEDLTPQLWGAEVLVPGTGAWLGADRLAAPAATPTGSALLLIAAAESGTGARAFEVADGLVTAAGGPLSYRGGATEPLPGLGARLELPGAIAVPGAVGVVVRPSSTGVRAGGLVRRMALTWALQHNLLSLPDSEVVHWRLDPGERLRGLAPFVEWGAPRPRLVDGALVWVAEGYLHAGGFPGVAPVAWRGRSVSYLRAAFTGVVAAGTGEVRLFARGRADPLTTAWMTIARGLVEPATAVPVDLADDLHYPGELFAVQARVLQRPHWEIGTLDTSDRPDSLPGPVRQAAFLPTNGQEVAALLEAEHREGADHLRLYRFPAESSTSRPGLLAERWQRLPYVMQMADSIRAGGARLVVGRVHLVPTDAGLVGYQVGHAVDSTGRATVALVNLALGARLGTGARTDAAWRNLRGELAALPVSVGALGQLREAREWLLKADSAFRRGDLAAFGRAFEALRAILDYPPGPAK